MMNFVEERHSPWRTPLLMETGLVTPKGVMILEVPVPSRARRKSTPCGGMPARV